MTISCVIIAYNAEATLSICIESIQEQTVRPQKIIVIDDNSNDVIISPTLITYAAILRRKHVLSVGNFKSNLKQFEDLELGKRLIDNNFTILSLPSLITFSCRVESIKSICTRYNRWNTLNLNKKEITPMIFFNILKSSWRIFFVKDLQSRDLYCCLFSLFFPLLFLTIRTFSPIDFNK